MFLILYFLGKTSMKKCNFINKKQPFAGVLRNKWSLKFPKFHRLEKACNFIKNRLQHSFFSVKFAKFLRIPFFTEHLRWLLLSNISQLHIFNIKTNTEMFFFLLVCWLQGSSQGPLARRGYITEKSSVFSSFFRWGRWELIIRGF